MSFPRKEKSIVGNTVEFSEPGFAYAWSTNLSLLRLLPCCGVRRVRYEAGESSRPVTNISTGAHAAPDAPRVALGSQAGSSKRSVANPDDAVAYAPDGLVRFADKVTTIISDGYFTRESWQALQPSSLVAASYNGRYMTF